MEKKKADLNSNVWSLACTLVELLTKKDCWEELIDSLDSVEEAGDNYEVNCMVALFRRKKVPSFEFVAASCSSGLQEILTDCFQYEPCQRPRVIDIVNVFSPLTHYLL